MPRPGTRAAAADPQQRPEHLVLRLAVDGEVETSTQARTITGLCVPYGPVGHSSAGPLTFAAGSLAFSQPGKVKLLVQHDPDRVIGYATELADTPEGLRGVFELPAGDLADEALAMAADGRRDGLSVGVLLDADVMTELLDKWWEGDTTPTAASGRLLETSLVALPAFEDAGVDGSDALAAAAAAAGRILTLAVPTWHTEPTAPSTTSTGGTMPTAPAPAAPAPADAAGTTTTTSSTGAGAPSPSDAPAPAPRAAAGAAATVAQEAPVYTFDGRGASFVRDMYQLRFGDLDQDGRQRVQRFQDAWRAGDAGQVDAFMRAAVETRTTEPVGISTDTYRPDLLIAAIDKGRPLVSRIGTVRIDNATPFRIPVEGEFTGVGDHVEGTAHVAEGDLTMSDVVVTPGAVSGAYRLSRELIDAYNPAIDQIAARAMIRNYRRVTEAKVVTALDAADAVSTLSVNTVAELRTALNGYHDIDDLPADLVAMGTTFYSALLTETDTTGRPMLPFVGPSNAVGTINTAGYTGAVVDGTDLVKVSSLSGALADDAFAFRTEHMFVGESPLQTFRFEEVEGPGVIKLALWAYFVTVATRPAGVVQLTTAAA